MLILREALASDAEFLWLALTYAASMTPGGYASVDDAKKDTYLGWYVRNWKRATDLGVIAEEAGTPVGAAWARLLNEPPHASKVATDFEPEIAIAVLPGHQNRGLGLLLMQALIEQARPKVPALMLSVRKENPAVRLYERLGFIVVQEIINRVGSGSLAMRLAF